MKKIISIFLVILILINVTACKKSEPTVVEERSRAVEVMEVKMTENNSSILYIGTVDAKEVTSISAKVGGKIERIDVQKGQLVQKGDVLLELDDQDIKFQLAASQAQMDAAQSNISKAEDALSYNQNLYDNIAKLYETKAVSKDQYDQVKLQLEVAVSTLEQARAQFSAAQIDYSYKSTLVQDSKIYAETNGSVVEITAEEGERIGPSMPVIILRSDAQVINIGIPQSDLEQVTLGSKASIDIDGDMAQGTITYISEAPDTATRTYNAEITVLDKKYRLGSIAKVNIETGSSKGIWIPSASVFASGEDYVYIIKEDRAFKRTIEILSLDNDKLLVTGIDEGEQLAVSGMKNLNDGSKVSIVQ